MSKTVNINVNRELAEKVKIIAENKFTLRTIDFYSEAIHEALIDWVKKNNRYHKPSSDSKNHPINPEVTI